MKNKKYIRPQCMFRTILSILKSGEGVDSKKFFDLFPNSNSPLSMAIWHIKEHEPDEYRNIYFKDVNGVKTYFYDANKQEQEQPQSQTNNGDVMNRIAASLEKIATEQAGIKKLLQEIVDACVIDASDTLDDIRAKQYKELVVRLYQNKNQMYNH